MSRSSDDNSDFECTETTHMSRPAALSTHHRRRWSWESLLGRLRYDKKDPFSRPRRKAYRNRILLGLFLFFVLGSIAALVWFALVSVLIHRLAPKNLNNGVSNIVAKWNSGSNSTAMLSPWPSDFTRGIVPVPMHSHNDETRSVPLFEALAAGCESIEADIWLENNDLFVGHDKSSLTSTRTLQSLYLDPLQTILENQNGGTNGSSPLGVYEGSPDTTLVLLLDVKSNGTETWPVIEQQLEPLRQGGFLTSWSSGTNVTQRQIRVVGSGNTPFSSVVANSTYRDIFFDAPLGDISNATYDTSNSYTASVSIGEAVGKMWFGKFSSKQTDTIQQQIAQAKAKGLVPRYWDTVAWPISWRNYVWKTLVENETGLLNVDAVKEAARWDWNWCTVGGLVLCGY